MEKKRECSRCKTELPLDNFGKDKRTPSGYRYECKACQYKAQIKSLEKKVKELEE